MEEKKIKVLNLFAGLGGNRTKWGKNCEVTAIENNLQISEIYAKRFPLDTLKTGDAYDYLEKHYAEFDLIWLSPPCQTHSKMAISGQNKTPRIPDTRLYGCILFLDRYFEGKYIVENVNPYYNPLLPPTSEVGRHLIWSNFLIPKREFDAPKKFISCQIKDLCSFHQIPYDLIQNFNTSNWSNHDGKRQILRNCVDYRIGEYIMNCYLKKEKNIEDYFIKG